MLRDLVNDAERVVRSLRRLAADQPALLRRSETAHVELLALRGCLVALAEELQARNARAFLARSRRTGESRRDDLFPDSYGGPASTGALLDPKVRAV